MRIAILSDTHGLLRPEVKAQLENADFILHAGDVGKIEIHEELSGLAPMYAVRGNVDRDAWFYKHLPRTHAIKLGEVWIYMLHNLEELDLKPADAGFDVVISGHTHIPIAEKEGGVLFLNPGSVGPKRFNLPISMAWLTIEGKKIQHKFVVF
ncbi:metallophosphoesterase family protein [Deinococcus roseus]|uniref:Phosphoesterase n=1 Tax=Deinococcus roseus TaxID=392414 RepID=A0ABQ2CX82_9DEIO|nr:metallophosphoesterase family protein [Deinococcus roseus]GGJ22672.1 phosphoesterase [Deinococcus roseus]